MTAPATPRDASTVIVLRGTPPALFMVKRTGKAAFMANAMVFPGGRLDPADCAPEWTAHCAESPDVAAARLGLAPEQGHEALGLLVAAIRETFEEAGLLLARPSSKDGPFLRLDAPEVVARFAAHRAALNAQQTTLLEIARSEGLVLATDALTYLARWVTPAIESRRFDTRFFAAHAPEAQEGAHDTHETTDSAWHTAAAALAAYDAGEIQLAPPTYRILLELAEHPTVEAVLGLRRGDLPKVHAPTFDATSGELTLFLPGDEAFAGPEAGAQGARNRISMRNERWISEGRGF